MARVSRFWCCHSSPQMPNEKDVTILVDLLEIYNELIFLLTVHVHWSGWQWCRKIVKNQKTWFPVHWWCWTFSETIEFAAERMFCGQTFGNQTAFFWTSDPPPPPPKKNLVGAYHLHPQDERAIFLHNDLLCNGTCSVSGGCKPYWGAQTEKIQTRWKDFLENLNQESQQK